MTACGSVCVRVKCSLTLSTCLWNELALQQKVRQDRKFQVQRDLQCLCQMHRCVELWSIECVRDKVRDTDSDYVMADTFLQRLAGKLSEKDGVRYSSTIAWLHCRFSFALLRGSILCIRGSRSRKRCPTHHSERELAIVESRLDLHWGPHRIWNHDSSHRKSVTQQSNTSDRTPCHHMQRMQVLELGYFLLITEVQPCLQSLELSHV